MILTWQRSSFQRCDEGEYSQNHVFLNLTSYFCSLNPTKQKQKTEKKWKNNKSMWCFKWTVWQYFLARIENTDPRVTQTDTCCRWGCCRVFISYNDCPGATLTWRYQIHHLKHRSLAWQLFTPPPPLLLLLTRKSAHVQKAWTWYDK